MLCYIQETVTRPQPQNRDRARALSFTKVQQSLPELQPVPPGWPKLWDMALDHGARGTAALQALFCTLTRPTFGSKPCPFCDDQPEELSHFDHFVTCHFPLSISSDRIVELLANESMDIFMYAKHFLHRVS